MAIDCGKLAAEKLTELGLSKKRVDGFVRDIQKFVAKHAADADFSEKLAKKISDIQQNVQKERIAASRSAVVLFEMSKSVADFHKTPIKAADAIFETASKAGKGARHSIDNMFQGLAERGSSIFEKEIKQKGIRDYLTGENDLDIAKAMWELGHGRKVEGMVPEAIAAAEVFMKANHWVTTTLRNAGIDVGEIVGYIMRQTHDPSKIAADGLVVWKKFILENNYVDVPKTLAAYNKVTRGGVKLVVKKVKGKKLSPAELEAESLSRTLDAIFYSRTKEAMGGQGSGRDFASSRGLHLKSPEAFMAYHDRYGYDGNLYGSTRSAIMAAARKTAIVTKLTVEPKKGIAHLKKSIMEADPTIKLRDLDKHIDTMYEMALGMDETLATKPIYKAMQTHRNLMTLSMLWGTIRPALFDWSSAANTATVVFGENYFEAVTKNMGAYFRTIPDPVLRAEIANDMHLNMELTQSSLYGRFSGQEIGSGMMAKMFEWQFRLNFVGPHTRAGKTAMAYRAKIKLHKISKSKKLTKENINLLNAYNFTPLDMQVLSKLDDLTANTIMDMKIESVPKSRHNIKGLTEDQIPTSGYTVLGDIVTENVARTPEQFKQELMLKFVSYANDIAEMSVPTPGKKEYRQWGRNVTPDSRSGQALRYIGQFKYTPTKQLNTMVYLASHLKKNGNSNLSTAWFLGYTATFAGMSAFTLGYLEDVAKGKEPEKLNAITFMDSLARSGHFGLVNDYVMGEYSMWHPKSETVVGPGLSQAFALGDWVKDAVREGDQKMGSRALDAMIYNTPTLGHPFMFHARQGMLDAAKDLTDNEFY